MKPTLLSLSLLLITTTLANPILHERDDNLPPALLERDAVPIAQPNLLAARAPAPEPKKHKSKKPKPHKSKSSQNPNPTGSSELLSADAPIASSGSATEATATIAARAPEPKKKKKSKTSKKASKDPNVPSITAFPVEVSASSTIIPTPTAKVKARAAEPEPEPEPAKSKKPSAKKSAANPAPSKSASKAPKVTARNALPDPEAEAEAEAMVGGFIEPFYPKKHKTTLTTFKAVTVSNAEPPTYPVSSAVAAKKRNAEAEAHGDPPNPDFAIKVTPTIGVLVNSDGIIVTATPTGKGAVKREAEAEAEPIRIPPEPLKPIYSKSIPEPTYKLSTDLQARAIETGIAKREAEADPIVMPPYIPPVKPAKSTVIVNNEPVGYPVPSQRVKRGASATVGGPDPTVTGP